MPPGAGEPLKPASVAGEGDDPPDDIGAEASLPPIDEGGAAFPEEAQSSQLEAAGGDEDAPAVCNKAIFWAVVGPLGAVEGIGSGSVAAPIITPPVLRTDQPIAGRRLTDQRHLWPPPIVLPTLHRLQPSPPLRWQSHPRTSWTSRLR